MSRRSRQGGALTTLRVRGEVEFDHVSFAYDSRTPAEPDLPRARRTAALTDISLKVAAGESLAIVGRSGSGKSTLVNLLPRFYDVVAGRGAHRRRGRARIRPQVACATRSRW